MHFELKNHTKIAKIITTSFTPRELREETGVLGYPPGYFSHSQNFPSSESVVDLIKLNISLEEKCDPGCDVDLVIINNDCGYIPGNKYLDELDGKELKRGKVRIFHRENYGRSFGGYNFAFMKLREEYDYFIFTEDDIVIWRDGYASNALEIMISNANCGFVAYQGIARKFKNLPLSESIHVHGGVGFSSTKVLNTVVSNFGLLPHATLNSSQSYDDIIEKGEVAFTNAIYKLGFQIEELNHNVKMYDFAYDIIKGVCFSRYLSGCELLIYNSKALSRRFCKKLSFIRKS